MSERTITSREIIQSAIEEFFGILPDDAALLINVPRARADLAERIDTALFGPEDQPALGPQAKAWMAERYHRLSVHLAERATELEALRDEVREIFEPTKNEPDVSFFCGGGWFKNAEYPRIALLLRKKP